MTAPAARSSDPVPPAFPLHPALRLPENAAELPTPALLLWPELVDANLRRMLALVGSPARLTPHVKTHKLPQIVARQVALGLPRCKVATIAEAEMAAGAGATDVLLAMPPVGPAQPRLVALAQAFPQVRFSTLADDGEIVDQLARRAEAGGVRIPVLVDLDVGQGRTGVPPGPSALALYRRIAGHRALTPGGLHAYDGHLRLPDPVARQAAVDRYLAEVFALRAALTASGLPVPRLVCGGTPTFPCLARQPEVECSPGTCLLWDSGYARALPDLTFDFAAALLTRVISRPGAGRLCTDLGHKAIASEMPAPRAYFPAFPGATMAVHSEEHLVLDGIAPAEPRVGDLLLAIPTHICPTVALHQEALVVRDDRVVDRWPITARARRISL